MIEPTDTNSLPTEERPADEEKSAYEEPASVEKPTPTDPPTIWKRSDLSDEDRQFARRLKARRFNAHMSRQSLAKLTQLSEATIKFIEKGRTKPTVGTIAYLLQVTELKLTLDDVPPSYDSDHVWSYELGAKTDWLERRMTTILPALMRKFQAGSADRIRRLSLAALSRYPTSKEMAALRKALHERVSKAPRTQNRDLLIAGGFQDVFWAFLNSNEFVLVH